MSKIKRCQPVKLICGFIYSGQESLERAKRLLKARLGEIDFESTEFDFNFTGYYADEFGKDLKRRFVAFNKLIKPEALPGIKVFTNRLEEKLAQPNTKYEVRSTRDENKRSINIDPGYLDLAKLVLATTKDFCHRIYLSSGIFAEATLVYRKDSFQPWEWTYPDYRTREYIETFNQIRKIYSTQNAKL